MKYLFWSAAIVLSLCCELILSHTLPIWGLKIDWVFTTLLVLTLRWMSPSLLFLGLFWGLVSDLFSHNMLGFYGFSFFVTLILARRCGNFFYDNNMLSTGFFVWVLSLAQGSLVALLLMILVPDTDWVPLFFKKVFPVACLQGGLGACIFFLLHRLEQWLRLKPEPSL